MDGLGNVIKIVPTERMRDVVNMGVEQSISNWISSMMWLVPALALALLAGVSRLQMKARTHTFAWLVWAAMFLFLAMDDGAAIHERIGTFFDEVAKGPTQRAGVPYTPGGLQALLKASGSYTWQIVVLPFYAVAGLFLMHFCWRELGQGKPRQYFVAAVALMAMAVVLDHYEVALDEHKGDFGIIPSYYVTHYQRVIEESCEFLAEGLFGLGFFLTLIRRTEGVDVVLQKAAA